MCAIIFICINANYVSATEVSSLNQDYLQQLNQKIAKDYKQGIAPEEIMENLSKSEIETLIDAYKTNEAPVSYGFTSEVENNPEVEVIDNLANRYYNYYVEHGKLPESINIDNIINSNEQTSAITPSASADYSVIMKSLGYTYTVQQIAAQLVAIGTYIGISSALPFLDLLALIVGMGLITFTYIAIAYSAIAVGVNNLILTWYTREHKISLMHEQLQLLLL